MLGVCGLLKWKFCLWYLDLINEIQQSAGIRRRTRVFRKRFHYALSFRAFNWIRERKTRRGEEKGCKFMGHSFAGVLLWERRPVSPTKMNFSGEEAREQSRIFYHRLARRHRWSRKSPAIAELRAGVGNAGEQHGKSNRHRADAIVREVLSSFRGGQSC